MTKTLQILKQIIVVMKEVITENKTLAMQDWYEDFDDAERTIHTCESPACILGYAALDDKSIEITNTFTSSDMYWYIRDCAIEEYSLLRLHDMLFNGAEEVRAEKFNDIFEGENSDDFPFLYTCNPTPQEAIDLLEFTVEKLEKMK